MRPFRFGIQGSTIPGGVDASKWAALARKVEDLGYSTMTVADHFEDQLAPVPALVAIADATTTLRIGSVVFCNDYRHPVVLAKEAATLDVLSDGRLELGIGAGWMTTDYEQSGVELDPPGVRIGRMEEAVAVVRGLFGDGPLTHAGKHYVITGLDGLPKPVQRPGPPIFMGGGGRRMLTVAGRHADIVGLNVSLHGGVIDSSIGPDATADATAEKVRWIRDAAGDRADGIELQVRVHLTVVTSDRQGTAEALGPAFGLTAAQALESPHALAGSVAQIVDTIIERRERWSISYLSIGLDAMDAFAPVVTRLAGT